MRILALDPATRCGFAWGDGAKRHYGVWDLGVTSTEHRGKRFIRLAGHLRQAARDWGLDRMAYEDASFGSINQETKAIHNGLRAVIEMVAAEIGVPFVAYKPASIKKFATGHGGAKKDQMIRACKTLLGIETTDDNVADALWILEMAQCGHQVQARTKWTKPKPVRQPKLF